MTTHVSTFEFFSSQNSSTSSLGPQSTRSVALDSVRINSNGISDPIRQPLIPLSAYNPPSSESGVPGKLFVGSVTNTNDGNVAGIAVSGQRNWHVNGRLFDNNNRRPIDRNPAASAGRNAPDLVLWFDGPAESAFREDGDLENAHGEILYAYSQANPYQTLCHFSEFEEEPPNSSSDATEVVTRLAQQLASPPVEYVLGELNTGQAVIALDCNFAGIAPEDSVYVEPGDIGGAGPDQMPTSVLENTASAFRFHPSVFLRRTQFIRSVARRHRDGFDIARFGVGMPIRIRSVTDQPIVSNWLIVVDGSPQLVQLNHGSLDLRRPRDIWNTLWVPLIRGNSSIGDVPILDVVASGGTRGPSNSQLRLGFLEYARCLPLLGTDITQTGTVPA
ncbi:MAG: hypothetical protein B7733_14600 [Myxococcales bacterium FL481]|nr:MAG: hypothetical protein B7733_14600 [Myxococcales bacterium FL481]